MKLIEWMNETKTTPNALAISAGVSPSNVSKYIKGQRKSLRPEIAEKLSQATGGKVSVLEILYPDREFRLSVELVPNTGTD